MRKFILKIFAFLLVIAFITCCINYAYIKCDKRDYQNIKKFKTVPSSVKVCNFGSSHGLFGFNYEDVSDVNCFNFALSSQVLTYDRRIFDEYKDNIAEGAVVFITISYFSFCIDDELNHSDFEQKNKRYYSILPPKLIKEYDFKTDIYAHYFPSLSAGVDLIKTFEGKFGTINEEWSKKATNIDLDSDAELVSRRHLAHYEKDESGNRINNQAEVDAVKYLINACREKGCTPVLITTPFTREYKDLMLEKDPDFVSDFYKQVDELVETTGVLYFDYSSDERFTNNYELFMNSDHLNKEGARVFVDILMREVVHYGSDESLIN